MITIFNGRQRSIGGVQESVYAQFDVGLRKYIRLFRQNKDLNAWAVFAVLALHANSDGWAWPLPSELKQETGLISDEAISRAIAHLRVIRIEDHPILHHYRQRVKGQWGRSYYHIFPDAGGVKAMPTENLALWVASPPPPQQGVAPVQPPPPQPALAQGGVNLSITSKKEESVGGAPRPRNLLFDALAECCWNLPAGFDSKSLGERGGRVGKLGKELLTALRMVDASSEQKAMLAREVRNALTRWETAFNLAFPREITALTSWLFWCKTHPASDDAQYFGKAVAGSVSEPYTNLVQVAPGIYEER